MKLIERNEASLKKAQSYIDKFGNCEMFEADLLLHSGCVYKIEENDFDGLILRCGSHSSLPYIKITPQGVDVYRLNGYLQKCAEVAKDEVTIICHEEDMPYMLRVVKWLEKFIPSKLG